MEDLNTDNLMVAAELESLQVRVIILSTAPKKDLASEKSLETSKNYLSIDLKKTSYNQQNSIFWLLFMIIFINGIKDIDSDVYAKLQLRLLKFDEDKHQNS